MMKIWKYELISSIFGGNNGWFVESPDCRQAGGAVGGCLGRRMWSAEYRSRVTGPLEQLIVRDLSHVLSKWALVNGRVLIRFTLLNNWLYYCPSNQGPLIAARFSNGPLPQAVRSTAVISWVYISQGLLPNFCAA